MRAWAQSIQRNSGSCATKGIGPLLQTRSLQHAPGTPRTFGAADTATLNPRTSIVAASFASEVLKRLWSAMWLSVLYLLELGICESATESCSCVSFLDGVIAGSYVDFNGVVEGQGHIWLSLPILLSPQLENFEPESCFSLLCTCQCLMTLRITRFERHHQMWC